MSLIKLVEYELEHEMEQMRMVPDLSVGMNIGAARVHHGCPDLLQYHNDTEMFLFGKMREQYVKLINAPLLPVKEEVHIGELRKIGNTNYRSFKCRHFYMLAFPRYLSVSNSMFFEDNNVRYFFA